MLSDGNWLVHSTTGLSKRPGALPAMAASCGLTQHCPSLEMLTDLAMCWHDLATKEKSEDTPEREDATLYIMAACAKFDGLDAFLSVLEE